MENRMDQFHAQKDSIEKLFSSISEDDLLALESVIYIDRFVNTDQSIHEVKDGVEKVKLFKESNDKLMVQEPELIKNSQYTKRLSNLLRVSAISRIFSKESPPKQTLYKAITQLSERCYAVFSSVKKSRDDVPISFHLQLIKETLDKACANSDDIQNPDFHSKLTQALIGLLVLFSDLNVDVGEQIENQLTS